MKRFWKACPPSVMSHSRPRLIYVLGIIVYGIFAPSLLCAQQAQNMQVQRYQLEIQDCQRIISSWEWQAHLQILFVISVILFGALITIFQGLKKGWCKPATLALGAAITILTSINAKIFPADYRVLQQSAIDGANVIDQLNKIVDDLGRPQADVTGLESQWLQFKTQFSGLQKAVLEGRNMAAQIGLEKTVFAQSGTPTWITHPPTDEHNLYFPGVAEDRSINAARQRSFENAVSAGAAMLLPNKGSNTENLERIISSSSAVDKSQFDFDGSKGVYRYYILLRISTDIKDVTLSDLSQAPTALTTNPNSEAPQVNKLNPTPEHKPGLLRVAQTLTSDPQLSAALLLYDLNGSNLSKPSLSREQARALQDILWKNSWLPTYRLGHAHINDIDVSPDGRLLVVGLEDHTARILELSSGEQLRVLEGHKGAVGSVRFSHDGSIIATASFDGTVRLWTVETGTDRGLRLESTAPLIGIVFTANDSHLITLDEESKVMIWNTSDGAKLDQLPYPVNQAHAITALAYDSESDILTTGHLDGIISFWDGSTGRPKGSWHDFVEQIRFLKFGKGRRLFALAGKDGAPLDAKLIDINAHRTIGTYSGDSRHVDLNFGGFDNSGKLFLVGSSLSDLKIWNPSMPDNIAVFHGNRGWRSGTFITTDPFEIIVWNKDTLRVLPTEPGQLIAQVRKHARVMSSSECSKYLNTAECPPLSWNQATR